MSLLSWLLGALLAGRVTQATAPPAPRAEPRAPRQEPHLGGLRVSSRAAPAFAAMDMHAHPYRLPRYPPGVIPEGMAMDDVNASIQNVFDFGSSFHGMFAEGLGFQGYPYLAELSQRAEYRRAVEVIAEEMTRRWIRVQAKGEVDKTEKIQELNDALDKFRVRAAFRQALEHDGYFGKGMLYLDYGETDPAELRTRLIYKPGKLAKGMLKGIRPLDPVWTGPNRYSASDPTREDFYKPQSWFVMGREIHATRLLTLISRPLPDILKPAYAFGGLSLTQLMKPYVDNDLRTRQAIADLVSSFTQFNLQTDLTLYLGGGDGGREADRIRDFAAMRNNRGLLVTDKEREALENVSAPLGTLDKLQAQSQERLSAVTSIPLVKFFGITPAGLNATAEPEMDVFEDHVHALQEKVCDDPLRIIIRLIQIDIWGEVDEDIDFEWVPLAELDDLTMAQLRKANSDTDAQLIAIGAIDADEVRIRIAAELDSPYGGLDLTKPAPGPPVAPGMESMFGGLGGAPLDPTAQIVAEALASLPDEGEDATASALENAIVAALSQGAEPIPAHPGEIIAAAITGGT